MTLTQFLAVIDQRSSQFEIQPWPPIHVFNQDNLFCSLQFAAVRRRVHCEFPCHALGLPCTAISFEKYFTVNVNRLIGPLRHCHRNKEVRESSRQFGVSIGDPRTKYYVSGVDVMRTDAFRGPDPEREPENVKACR